MKKSYIYISVIVVISIIVLILLCTKNNNKQTVTKDFTISEAIVYLQPGKEYNLSFTDNSDGTKNYVFESSNPSIATVDRETGRIEAVSSGKVTIRAVDENNNKISDYCEVVVEGPKEKTKKTSTYSEKSVSFSLNKAELLMDEGTTEKILATVNSSDKTIIWSSDNESVATVSDGVVTAVSAGTAIISAKSSNGSIATCKVTVLEKVIKVSSIKISANKTAVYVGSTLELSIITYPSDATKTSIAWESDNESVATVSNGIVTGIKSGIATITARSSNGKESTVKIAVLDSNDEISSIRLNYGSSTLKIGDSLSLVAVISPSYASNHSVTWSTSNSNVATISDNGEVIAKSVGTATITARSSNGKEAKCIINVVNRTVEITSIKLNKSNVEVRAGEKVELNTIISPTNATNQKITWISSNEKVATVSYGTVTTINPGTVTITARSNNGKEATCVIVVLERLKPVTKISLSTTFVSLYVGQSKKITATLTPSDATDKNVTWRSENTNIATVSSDGTIKGVSPGLVEIIATSSNGKEASMKVKVESGVTKITLNKTNTALYVGQSKKLVATITPKDAPDKTVTWSSSDSSIVSVSNGVINAKKVGTATITAKSIDGKVATCTVVVSNPTIDVTDIKLNLSNVSIKVGEYVTLVATITPSNATDKTVTWLSSDPKIATVSNTGVVTGLKTGEVTITAKSSNGKKATSKVVVKSNKYVILDKTSITCKTGENVIVTTNSSSSISRYVIGNNKVINVNSNDVNKYTVSCLSVGFTTVQFYGKDGASALLSVNVKQNETGYNIAKDSKFAKYEQIASCYSSTMAYRIIRINGNYYTLVWMNNPNRQINNALASANSYGVASAETIFNSRATSGKCFVGINASFFNNDSPQSNVVIAEGRVAKDKGKSAAVIGINSNGNLTFYRDKTSQELINDGVRNTWKISSHVSADGSSVEANRTQIFQYDSNNYVLYSGYGTVKSGLTNVHNLLPSINEGFNLDGGGSRKLYYRTKLSSLTKVYGGYRQIPDTLYISE